MERPEPEDRELTDRELADLKKLMKKGRPS